MNKEPRAPNILRIGPSVILHWLDGAESERRARIAMMLFSGLFALRLAFTRFAFVARIPTALFAPPFYLSWLKDPPSRSVLIALQIVGVGAAVIAIAVRRPKLWFGVAWIVYLVLAGLRASRGKILHPDVLPLLASLPLLCTPDDASVRTSRVDARFGIPMRASMVIVALAYFFSGYQKFVTAGIDWITSDNVKWVLIDGGRAAGVRGRALGDWVARHSFAARSIAAGTILVELSGLFALSRPTRRVAFAVAVTGMHVGIWVTLNLDYSLWIATVWIVMIDWSAVLASFPRDARSLKRDRAN